MRANRQDAWTKEEDRLLANNVIDYIKKGYTQLDSFKYVAEQLNRTPAACGFRWNATIRKRYALEIEAAKQARKKFTMKILMIFYLARNQVRLHQLIKQFSG